MHGSTYILGGYQTDFARAWSREGLDISDMVREAVLGALRESGPMVLQLSASPDDGPLAGTVRPRPLPPGRGILVTRAVDECTVQVAWVDPG